MPVDALFDEYESALIPWRDQTSKGPIAEMVSKPPREFAAFLINFCLFGIPMTEAVDRWIRQAGEATRGMGEIEVGDHLVKHSIHEMGHHLLFLNDARNLIEWWNGIYSPHLDSGALLERDWPSGVRAYRDLHESTVRGKLPFCQVAIEYEIERLSIVYGPYLFKLTGEKLGKDVIKHLSFLSHHIELDVGHTQLNRFLLQKLLKGRPDSLPQLIEVGRSALSCYSQFLENALAQCFLS